MMFAVSRAEGLHRQWVSWARENGFVEDGHDDRFRGMLDGVEVMIEDGIRTTGLYTTEVTIFLAAGERLGRIKHGDDHEDDTPRIRALRAFMRGKGKIAGAGIRIDATSFLMTLGGGRVPETVVPLIYAVIDVWRQAESAVGPYR